MKILKKTLLWVGIVILVLAAGGFTLYLIYLRPVMTMMKQTQVVKYDKDLTIILGGGGNTGVLTSDSLVIVIDTKMDEAADELSRTIKDLAGSKPILVINTHFHPDHSDGNRFYKEQSILAGGHYTSEFWTNEADKQTLPTKWVTGKMDIKMGDDTVTVVELNRNAHTASDVFVYLHKRKMLFGGDVILNKQAPALFGVADVDGYLKDFEELPAMFNIKTIVPGHGPIGGMEVLETFRQYFIDMKTAASDDSKRAELVAKYKDWTQVPFVMSPGATINVIKREK